MAAGPGRLPPAATRGHRRCLLPPHTLVLLAVAAADSSRASPSGYDLTSLRRNLLHQPYLACPAALHYPDPSAPTPEHLTAEDMLKTLQEQQAALDDAVAGCWRSCHISTEMVQDMLQQLRSIFEHGGQQLVPEQGKNLLTIFISNASMQLRNGYVLAVFVLGLTTCKPQHTELPVGLLLVDSQQYNCQPLPSEAAPHCG